MVWSVTVPYILLFLAGMVAGFINSIAGGGTLFTFPTLVWLGRPPILANATNSVALWPGSLTGMIGFRREMTGSGRLFLFLAVPSLLGGVGGAVLLLHTPERFFSFAVPWLILFATGLIAFQEPIGRILQPREEEPIGPGGISSRKKAIILASQFCIGIYGGYFGAGIGILMLALLGLFGFRDIHRMNGMKNGLAMCINGIAAVYFILSHSVIWSDAVALSAGSIAGAYGGAGLARRLGRPLVKKIVILVGLFTAFSMLWRTRL